MIDLQIGGWCIDADENQHILGKPCKRKQKDKDGNVVEVDAFDADGYFPTLGSALHGAYKRIARELTHSTNMTLQEAVRRCEAVERHLLGIGEAERLKEEG